MKFENHGMITNLGIYAVKSPFQNLNTYEEILERFPEAVTKGNYC